MRSICFLLCVIVLQTNIFSQAQKFEFPKLKSNSVGMEGTQLMIDQGETSVSDWLSYVYNSTYLQYQGDADMKSMIAKVLPDTNMLPEKYRFIFKLFYRWMGPENDDKSYINEIFYGSNIAKSLIPSSERSFGLLMKKEEEKNGLVKKCETFIELPMVGVSFKQVQDYLLWREELASAEKTVTEKKYQLHARLLRQEEWMKFSLDFGPHFLENKTAQIDTINKEGCYLLNIRVDKPCASVLEGRKKYGEGSVGVFSYNPDRKGLYNMYGNVAEMLDTEGTAIGGSYNDYGNICKPDKIISYTKPQPWLGFRCIFEILK